MQDLRDAATRRALGKRSKISLCVHGINANYCMACAAKKPRPKKSKAAAEAPVAPETAAQPPTEPSE